MQRQKSDGKKAEACVTVRCFRSGSVQRLSTSLARAHSNWCLCELLRPKRLSTSLARAHSNWCLCELLRPKRLSTSLARAHLNWCLCELLRPKKLSLWSLLTFPPSCFIWSLSSSAHDSSCPCVLLSVLYKLMCGWVGECSYICGSSHALVAVL